MYGFFKKMWKPPFGKNNQLVRFVLQAGLLILFLVLTNGCFCDYEYNEVRVPLGRISPFETTQEIEARADVSKIDSIRPKDWSFAPLKCFIPFTVLLYDKVKLDVTQDLTERIVLTSIKDFPKRVGYPNHHGRIEWYPYNFENEKDVVVIEIGEPTVAEFIFIDNKLVYWSFHTNDPMEGINFKIGKYKGDKFYPMPLTVAQLKEIFGEPNSINTRFNLK